MVIGSNIIPVLRKEKHMTTVRREAERVRDHNQLL